MKLSERLNAIDRYQQRHRRLTFIAAVVKKFQDDQAGSLAALIAYYGFVSLFPLLLVFVSILGFVIHGDPAEQQKVLSGTLGQVPLLADLIKESGKSAISGSGAALGIGLITSLLAGLGVTNAAQNAFNRVWHVPFKQRPDYVKTRVRGLGLLLALGTLLIASTLVAGFTTAAAHGLPADIAGVLLALLLNIALFTALFRLLSAVDVSTRALLPGAIVGAIGWQIVQHLGGLWAGKVAHETTYYGTFGIVLGLMAVLYLGAQITVFAAEINVVRCRRLYPRSLFGPPLTDADKRALTSSAEVEERVHEENVDVTFDSDGSEAPSGNGQDRRERAVQPSGKGG